MAKWGDFDNWMVREVKESGIIGGDVKYLYEIAKGDTLRGVTPYINGPEAVWSTSNVLAVVKGIVKTSCSVYPEKRGDGYCARLETRIEKIKVLGLIDMNVLASGTIYLGKMKEPIKNTNNPQGKLEVGIPFSTRPKALQFDYKVTVGSNRIKASGFGGRKILGDKDYAECVVMLQHRWEDEEGNVYSKRVGTGYYRFTQSESNWIDGFNVPIYYGDITNEPFYKDYMQLIPFELSNYTTNSKGEATPIREVEWGSGDETPTHVIVRFSSSHGEAYIGDPVNRLWVDNVKFIY